jgi:hypothetical protein
MVKILVRRQKPTLIPAGISAGPKKIGAHVVIHTMNVPTQFAEVFDHLRADQT